MKETKWIKKSHGGEENDCETPRSYSNKKF